jgi:crossover junction endodeoxyribonuclease RusA
MTVEITLDVPKRILSPNGRSHHHAKARAIKEYRTKARLFCMTIFPPSFKPRWNAANVKITWYHPHARFPDRDNALASLKAGFDGLTDYGLFSDDRGLTQEPVQFQKHSTKPRVVLTITGQ